MSHQSRVAKRYSKAFVGAVQEAGNLEKEVAGLRGFCELKRESKVLNRYLLNVTVNAKSKIAVIEDICKEIGASDMLRRFLVLLAAKGRLDCLDEIEVAVQDKVNEIMNIRELAITTSAPISEKSREVITQALSEQLSAQIRLEENVDPDLWGGAVVQVGSTIYDGSLKGKIQRLREELVKEN